MKITITAGTLVKGDKIGRRTVRLVLGRDYGLGYLVYFGDDKEPTPYGKNEPITVTLEDVTYDTTDKKPPVP